MVETDVCIVRYLCHGANEFLFHEEEDKDYLQAQDSAPKEKHFLLVQPIELTNS